MSDDTTTTTGEESANEQLEEDATDATQAVSSSYKVLGEFGDGSGAGVLGKNTADSGTPVGVEGAVPNANGGYGLATPHDARVEGRAELAAIGGALTDGQVVTDLLGGSLSVESGVLSAPSASLDLDDGTTTVTGASELAFGEGLSVTDEGGGKVTVSVTAGPEFARNSDPPSGGTLRIGVPQPPDGLNHLATDSTITRAITSLVYEPGVVVDPDDSTPRPWVFTDWTVENVGTGQPDVYVDVRDGLTFTDGVDLSVSDVVFTYDYLLTQQPPGYGERLSPVDTVQEATNGWDVHISLTDVVPTWHTRLLGIWILPEHVWSGVDYANYQPSQNVADGEPAGLGFGQVTAYDETTAVDLTFRDPSQYTLGDLTWVGDNASLIAGGPFLDGVTFDVYGSESVLEQDLLDGTIDARLGSLTQSTVNTVNDREDVGTVEGREPAFRTTLYNLRRTPLDDITFRQALRMLWEGTLWEDWGSTTAVTAGDVPWPPAYPGFRPELAASEPQLTTDPAVNAFTFRRNDDGTRNRSGVRAFLEGGDVIDGSGGTYAGVDYPGSLTGVNASISSPLHDYAFGQTKSQVLKDAGVGQEIYVNGQTIPEILGRPLQFITPPSDGSPVFYMVGVYLDVLKSLGIPIVRKILTENTIVNRVFVDEDFDIAMIGWDVASPFDLDTIYSVFHSDNADDLSDGNEPTFRNNAMGYGLFDYADADTLITNARSEMEPSRRDPAARQTLERIYLDSPVDVVEYGRPAWGLATQFGNPITEVADPGESQLNDQLRQLYDTTQS